MKLLFRLITSTTGLYMFTLALLAALLVPLYLGYVAERTEVMLDSERASLANIDKQFNQAFFEASADNNLLANLPILHNGDAQALNYAVLERYMLNFAKVYTHYDQVRLLDALGQEQVRLNKLATGKFRAVNPALLQNKADRYYFTNAIDLPRDHTYISPIDLNVEFNQVELPHKPVIRFASPIYDQMSVNLVWW